MRTGFALTSIGIIVLYILINIFHAQWTTVYTDVDTTNAEVCF